MYLILDSKHKYKELSLTALRKIKADKAAWGGWEGKTHHKPVDHFDLIDVLMSEVTKLGLTPTAPACYTAHNGGSVAACFSTNHAVDGLRLGLGVVASNVGRARMRVYAGGTGPGKPPDYARVVAECLIGGKYTLEFDLRAECRSLVAGWHSAAAKAAGVYHAMKETELSEQEASAILMRAGRDKVVPWKRMGKLDWLFREQRGRTALDMLKAYSAVMDGAPPMDQMSDLYKFCRLLTGRCPAERTVAQ